MNGVHPKAIGMDWIFCTKEKSTDSYILLEEFATINDALESCCIEGKPFKEIIVDGDTELVGQD